MKRLLEVVPFYSLDEAMEYLDQGGDLLPLHHVWCYDQFKKAGYEVQFVPHKPSGFLGKLGKLIQIETLQQQIKTLQKAKDYDVIFDPFMQFTFLIAFLKMLGLFHKPVIAIAQRAYVVNKKNPLKRFRQYLVRYVYFKGLDKIIFINKTLYEESKKYKVPGNTDYLRGWGADHEFFERYNQEQQAPPKLDYIYATGGAARDYGTLIQAFKNLNVNLRITTRPNFASELNTEIPPNVHVDSSITPSLTSTGKLRGEYYNSLAVALPINQEFSFAPFGSTVFFEAMAAGKALIATDNKAFAFDIEEAGVGILVDYYDREGWEKAIKYLFNNPEKAKEMGRKGQELSREVYNYHVFSREIIGHTDVLLTKP